MNFIIKLFKSVSIMFTLNFRKRRMSINSFISSTRSFIPSLRSCKSPATIRNYITAINALAEFDAIEAREMNEYTIADFQAYLLKTRCRNTASCYIRSIRSLYNMMADKGIVTQCHLFRMVSTSNARTRKRAISTEQLKRVKSLSINKITTLYMYRDFFLFSVYAFGMPFVDLAHLRKSNITNDTIIYERAKTKQTLRIPINSKMREIMMRYWHDDSPYVFPILADDATDSIKSFWHYQYQLARYNRYLKVLAQKVGIESITSYVARHTWASVALRLHVDVSAISQAMGHSNLKTTQIYLKELDDNTMKTISNRICSVVR